MAKLKSIAQGKRLQQRLSCFAECFASSIIHLVVFATRSWKSRYGLHVSVNTIVKRSLLSSPQQPANSSGATLYRCEGRSRNRENRKSGVDWNNRHVPRRSCGLHPILIV